MELEDVVRKIVETAQQAEFEFGEENDEGATEFLMAIRNLLMEFFNIEQDVEAPEGIVRCPMCGHLVIK